MSTLVTPPFAGAAPVPPDPAPAVFPRPFRWTANEFDRLNAAGLSDGRRLATVNGDLWEGGQPLRWTVDEFDRVDRLWKERRLFLVRGVIWEQGPMNTPHAFVMKRLTPLLLAHVPPGHYAQFQLPLLFEESTEVFPDGAIVPGADVDYLTAHPATALLVVEVSDTTIQYDSTTKAELYATAGVPTYWIVDIENRLLHVLADPQPLPPGGVAYRSHVEYREADAVPGPDGRPVPVASLLPPAG